MTVLSDFQQFVTDAETGTQFAAWRKANPNDYGRWAAVRDLILQGRPVPTLPTMQTAHGRELIDAAKLYLDQAPVPPTPPPTSGWSAAIAYTKTRPSFTPARLVGVTSASQLDQAVTNLRAGDRVTATAPFSYSGEFTVRGKQLAATAELDLAGVTFAGYTSPAAGMVAVYLTGNKNLRVYLDQVTNPGGSGGVDFYNNDTCLLWVNRIHDVGGTGLMCVTNAGPIMNCDIYAAEITNWEMNYLDDPHAEQGTGNHACQFGDGSSFAANIRLSLWAHDGPHGSALQYGTPQGGIQSNQIYLKAERLTMASTSQISGSALQLWGGSPVGADVQYLEANDCQGYAVSCDNEYNADFSGVVVKYGRQTNTRLNPHWSAPTWNPGPTYQDVQ